ncbi:MAG: type II CRISPR-associated endonuclease Cas1 [Phycisphaerales bacterium]
MPGGDERSEPPALPPVSARRSPAGGDGGGDGGGGGGGGGGVGRVLDFSLGQAHLSLRHEQLLIRREGMPDTTTPIEEIAVVVLSSRMVTCTLPVLDAMMRHGAAVVVCDRAMHPSGMMLPLAGHFQQTRRMIAQATAGAPARKQVWRQIVVAKVRAQAATLEVVRGHDGGLRALAAGVRSGDAGNVEARAAQRYWPVLFDDPDFRRRTAAPDQNRMLNYGYAVLRAAVGRALVAAGLHPSLGVHHHARENAFCLADDLMEPYRPLVDAEVVEIVGEMGGDVALDGPVKARLVGVLHERLEHGGRGGEARPALEWIARSAASLARILGDRGTTGHDPGERLFFPDGLVEPPERGP